MWKILTILVIAGLAVTTLVGAIRSKKWSKGEVEDEEPETIYVRETRAVPRYVSGGPAVPRYVSGVNANRRFTGSKSYSSVKSFPDELRPHLKSQERLNNRLREQGNYVKGYVGSGPNVDRQPSGNTKGYNVKSTTDQHGGYTKGYVGSGPSVDRQTPGNSKGYNVKSATDQHGGYTKGYVGSGPSVDRQTPENSKGYNVKSATDQHGGYTKGYVGSGPSVDRQTPENSKGYNVKSATDQRGGYTKGYVGSGPSVDRQTPENSKGYNVKSATEQHGGYIKGYVGSGPSVDRQTPENRKGYNVKSATEQHGGYTKGYVGSGPSVDRQTPENSKGYNVKSATEQHGGHIKGYVRSGPNSEEILTESVKLKGDDGFIHDDQHESYVKGPTLVSQKVSDILIKSYKDNHPINTFPDDLRPPEISSAHITEDMKNHLRQHGGYIKGYVGEGPSVDRPATKTDDDGNKVHPLPGVPGKDYPIFGIIPETKFECQEMPYPGYYADTETECQVWHFCQLDHRQVSYLCPNGSIFNQKLRVCDWWYNFNCEDAPLFYNVNGDLYRLPVKTHYDENFSSPQFDYATDLGFPVEHRKATDSVFGFEF